MGRLPSLGYKARPLPEGGCRNCWGSGKELMGSWGRNGDELWPSAYVCKACGGTGKARTETTAKNAVLEGGE